MRSTLLQTITALAAVAAVALLLAPAAAATQEDDAAMGMGEEMKRNFHQRFIPHRPDKPVSKRELYYRYMICYLSLFDIYMNLINSLFSFLLYMNLINSLFSFL
jgi:hypothetical protein